MDMWVGVDGHVDGQVDGHVGGHVDGRANVDEHVDGHAGWTQTNHRHVRIVVRTFWNQRLQTVRPTVRPTTTPTQTRISIDPDGYLVMILLIPPTS